LVQLLDNKLYREWFYTKPPVANIKAPTYRWIVYAQKKEGGSWAKVDKPSYRTALKTVDQLLELDYWDLAIHSRRRAYPRPTKMHPRTGLPARMKLPGGHVWCPYCRRPVLFKWFSKHHAFRSIDQKFDPSKLRCTICGISDSGIRGLGRDYL
jgi:hypothetical protein